MKLLRISQCLRFLLIVAIISVFVVSLSIITKRAQFKVPSRPIVPKVEVQTCLQANFSGTVKKINITSRPSLKLLKPSCQYSDLSSLTTSPDSPASPIPRLVHWIYKSTKVPHQYIAYVRKCRLLNPDHDFIFWSDASALDFVKAKYPAYHYLFERHFKDGLEFSDALRYFILHHFGGVYLDMDVECLRPFTESLKCCKCVLDRERDTQTHIYWNIPYFAMNSVMACQRNHPFFKEAIDLLKKSAIKEKGVLARTGPGFLTTHFQNFSNSSLGKERPVVLAPHSVFSPLMDENHIPIFRRICEGAESRKGLRKAACEEFKRNGYSHGNVAELTKNSIAIHHFMHLGWGSWKFMIEELSSICKVARVNIYRS